MGQVLASVRRLGLMRRLRELGLWRGYLVFALCHSLWKITRRVLSIRRFQRLTKHLPGDDMDMLARDLLRNAYRMHDFNHERIEAVGASGAPLVRKGGPETVLYCNTPESIQWMLKDEFATITKPNSASDPLFYILKEFLGDSIFTLRHGRNSGPDHAKWQWQRKTASLVFTKSNFEQHMHHTFVTKGANLVSLVRRTAETNERHVADGQPLERLEMQGKFFAFTFDVIENVFFGIDTDSVLAEEESAYAEGFDAIHRNMVKYIVTAVGPNLLARYVLPWPLGDLSDEAFGTSLLRPLWRAVSPHYREFRKRIKEMDEETYRRVKALRADPNLPNRKDMISLFLNGARAKGVADIPGSPGAKHELSDRDVRDLVMNMLIAGRDTSACTLTWLLYYISLPENADVQTKLAEEIARELGGRTPSADEVTADRLPYLNGVLYEALRLSPPVPIDVKIATEDVQYGDTTVPKGTKLAYFPYGLGRQAERYPEPLAFRPERWIPFAEKEKSMYAFPVFQAGNRFCLGMRMAILETKTLLCMLFAPQDGKRLSFLLDPAEKHHSASLMLTMSLRNNRPKDVTNPTHELWLHPTLVPALPADCAVPAGPAAPEPPSM